MVESDLSRDDILHKLLIRLGYLGLLLGAGWWFINGTLFPADALTPHDAPAALLIGAVMLVFYVLAPLRFSALFFVGSITLTACWAVLFRGYSTLAPSLIFVALIANIAMTQKYLSISTSLIVALFSGCSIFYANNPFYFGSETALEETLLRPNQAWLNLVTCAYLILTISMVGNYLRSDLVRLLTEHSRFLNSELMLLNNALGKLKHLYRYVNKNILLVDGNGRIIASSNRLLALLQASEQDLLSSSIEYWFEPAAKDTKIQLNVSCLVRIKHQLGLGALQWRPINPKPQNNSVFAIELIESEVSQITTSNTNQPKLCLQATKGLAELDAQIGTALATPKLMYILVVRLLNGADLRSKIGDIEVSSVFREHATHLHQHTLPIL